MSITEPGRELTAPVATADPAVDEHPPMKWRKFDTGWTISLFGTANGAGIPRPPSRSSASR